MRHFFLALFTALLLVAATCELLPTFFPDQDLPNHLDKIEEKLYPSDHFFFQRSYPDEEFALAAYESALQMAKRKSIQQTQEATRSQNDGFDQDWTIEGPGNIGGRINTVAIHPTNNDIIYVGTQLGGIFKTVDGGVSWFPIFDDQLFLAIAHISFDPSNPDVVYVGTGDPNISGYPAIGDGVYKSTDAGNTWTHLGLTNQRIISKVYVDPSNSNTVYAATMGIPFIKNNDRGLYKSTDGGSTWTQSLFVSDSAGVIDMLIDPSNSNNVYAVSWNRIRSNSKSLASGPDGKIWKSTDGGTTWNPLSTGLPTGDMSRIGIAMSGTNSQVLFAIYVNTSQTLEGVYKSTNGGSSWTDITGNLNPNIVSNFGWYFGKIRVNPTNDNEIWALGVNLYYTTDGGANWQLGAPPWFTYEVHADKHDLQFGSSNSIFLTTDGGLYKSTDSGANWTDIENIPNTQFYRVAIDPFQPGVYYGGAQDNGSTGGNASNINSWPRLYGGDGFQMRFDQTDTDVWYVETQNGGLTATTDDGSSFIFHMNAVPGSDRRNWDMPFVLSHFDPDTQYIGTHQVYRNGDGPGGYWLAISPTLTDPVNIHPRFHTITTVNESPVKSNILYAGTTDGNVWISTSDFAWTEITGTLPNRYVTSVKPSPTDSMAVFVTHSGYKDNEFIPHIHYSSDKGANWVDISGDLPQLAINDVYPYPLNDSIVFVATDGGVYGTVDRGNIWKRVGKNMPIFAVYDLEIDTSLKVLVAGTFARSIMTYSLDTLLNPSPLTAPLVTIDGKTEFCEGDTTVLSAPAGMMAYNWSNGDTTQSIQITASGSYSLTVTHPNGCVSPASEPIVITVNAMPPTPGILITGDTEICPGDSVLLSAPAGYNEYTWSNGADTESIFVGTAGTFSVEVTDAIGCKSLPSATVSTSLAELPTADFGYDLVGVDFTAADNSLNADTYLWDFGDMTTSTDTNPAHTYTASGTYTVTLIISNPCGADTLTTEIMISIAGIDPQPIWFQQMDIFPIPAQDILNIRAQGLSDRTALIQLFDIQGRLLIEESINSPNRTLNAQFATHNLAKGVYLLKVKSGSQWGHRRILVK